MAAHKEIFTSIYANNTWNSSESRSGPGSTVDATRNLVSQLPDLFKEYKIKSILDIPCGDFNWMSQVPMESIDYVGIDIVRDLIIRNQNKYPDKKFLCLDLLLDNLPQADLVICRDCLGHFPTHAVRKALFNICETKSKYLLATNFPDNKTPIDIKFGEWRPINLSNGSIGLPKPLVSLNEGLQGAGIEDKSMSLWSIDAVKTALMAGE
jgi:SAM-dependent methyltransferase